jgi:alkylated DNA repair dioxygenase AlkB
MESITLTFCDVAENHVGMQQLGALASEGYSVAFLRTLLDSVPRAEWISLGEDVGVLILREFVADHAALFGALSALPWDTKYFDRRRSKVLNKRARFNLCFADTEQEPDYEQGKGRVIAYETVPGLPELRQDVFALVGGDAGLQCEGNQYLDVTKNGIDFHGDAERRKVIGVRFGASHELAFQWYLQGNPTGDSVRITLNGGDAYIMSSKAVGHDWLKKSIATLRHAAGAAAAEPKTKNKKAKFL